MGIVGKVAASYHPYVGFAEILPREVSFLIHSFVQGNMINDIKKYHPQLEKLQSQWGT